MIHTVGWRNRENRLHRKLQLSDDVHSHNAVTGIQRALEHQRCTSFPRVTVCFCLRAFFSLMDVSQALCHSNDLSATASRHFATTKKKKTSVTGLCQPQLRLNHNTKPPALSTGWHLSSKMQLLGKDVCWVNSRFQVCTLKASVFNDRMIRLNNQPSVSTKLQLLCASESQKHFHTCAFHPRTYVKYLPPTLWHNIIDLWVAFATQHWSVSVSIWQIENEVQKVTFLQIGPLN